MDLRMNPNSLFAILMRRPWWVSGGIAVGLVALARLVLPQQWFIVGAASAIPFLAIAAIAGWRSSAPREKHGSRPRSNGSGR